jgi:hypothetical protein
LQSTYRSLNAGPGKGPGVTQKLCFFEQGMVPRSVELRE